MTASIYAAKPWQARPTSQTSAANEPVVALLRDGASVAP
jgi:hypothetical protein